MRFCVFLREFRFFYLLAQFLKVHLPLTFLSLTITNPLFPTPIYFLHRSNILCFRLVHLLLYFSLPYIPLLLPHLIKRQLSCLTELILSKYYLFQVVVQRPHVQAPRLFCVACDCLVLKLRPDCVSGH